MVQDGSITSDQAVHMTDLYDMLGGLDVHNAVGVLFEKQHTSHYAQASCLAKLTAQRAVVTLEAAAQCSDYKNHLQRVSGLDADVHTNPDFARL